jgi:hypothetical protein
VSDYKRNVLTAQEAMKRFGKTGQFGATTIDGKILDAVFAANPEVMAMGRQLLYKKMLKPDQISQFTFLIDGNVGSYQQFRQLPAGDKISVAVLIKDRREASGQVLQPKVSLWSRQKASCLLSNPFF